MLKMSSSSSTTTIPTPPRITCTALDARPAVLTKAPLTPSSRRATCGRLGTLSGCWKRPGRPSTPNCVSWWTPAEGGEVAVRHAAVGMMGGFWKKANSLCWLQVAGCVTVGAAPTTPTSCTGTSVTAACAPVAAARTAVMLATAARKTAPLPPTETKVGITEIATPPAQTSIRVTTAAAGATTPSAGGGVRITASSARLCFLSSLPGCSPSWLSSLPLSSHPSWGSWGKHLMLLPPHPLLQAFNLQGNRIVSNKPQNNSLVLFVSFEEECACIFSFLYFLIQLLRRSPVNAVENFD